MHPLVNDSQARRFLHYFRVLFAYRLRRRYFRLYSTSSKNGKSDQIKNGHSNETSDNVNKCTSVEKDKPQEKPPSEPPEEPTTCCMSGCPNCVWLEYAEKLTEYYKDGGEKSIKEINEKITDPNIKAYLLHEIRMRNKK